MSAAAHALPTRDLAFTAYPQREIDVPWPRLRDAARWLRAAVQMRYQARLPARVAQATSQGRMRLMHLHDARLLALLPKLRAQLRRSGLKAEAAGYALAVVAEFAQRRLGLTPYPTQLLAAWLMLEGRLVEMATGEGKTLAAGLAAAAAALAGVPVHLLTANDYLVQRDREKLLPMYEALGLSSACVLPAMTRTEREAAYRCDIVHLTARELAFDYLRDHAMLGGVRDPRLLRALAISHVAHEETSPVLPGLCLALIDEADSILLDEATVPLILAAPADATETRSCEHAMAIAGGLRRGRDYAVDAVQRRAALTEEGRTAVNAEVQRIEGDPGLMRPARRAHELVAAALSARHALQRDRDYAVLGGQLQLIDEVTGRIADGRQWTGALQAMVELKEGLAPSPATRVSAQITYQRFFPRYLRVGGMSGTLAEARHELRVLYDGCVERVPLARPDRRQWLGERLFADDAARDRALVERVKRLVALGRPVLVGTASVAASIQVGACLQAAGIDNQLLNAVQDAHEAERIARAGQAGVVTVATNIAGRGTDIALDAAARAAGGLHVIATTRNRSRRIDRQLIGRAARHGDPGSAERLLSLDDALFSERSPLVVRRLAERLARGGVVPRVLALPLAALAQRRAEWADRALRRDLRRGEAHADALHAFAGSAE
jgi:preprotein translocase subunit SecA